MPAHAILLWEASDILLRWDACVTRPHRCQKCSWVCRRRCSVRNDGRKKKKRKLAGAGQNRTAGFRPAASSKFLIRGVRKSSSEKKPLDPLSQRRPLLSGTERHSSCTRTAWDAFNQAGGQEWPHSNYDTYWGGKDRSKWGEKEEKSSSGQETFSLFPNESCVFGGGRWRVSAGVGPSCLRWHCLREPQVSSVILRQAEVKIVYSLLPTADWWQIICSRCRKNFSRIVLKREGGRRGANLGWAIRRNGKLILAQRWEYATMANYTGWRRRWVVGWV